MKRPIVMYVTHMFRAENASHIPTLKLNADIGRIIKGLTAGINQG
jgi:hypothetical protein